jgi:DNA-binding MarR family transcriptional regulator
MIELRSGERRVEPDSGASLKPSPLSRALLRPKVGINISARLGLLAGSLVTTATSTYGRLGLGSIGAKVLLALECEPIKAVKVCQLVGVDRAAVSRTVQVLTAEGLVSRTEGRGAYLSLTQRGAELCRGIKAVTYEREERLFEGFSPDELELLIDYLRRMALNMPGMTALTADMDQTLGEDIDRLPALLRDGSVAVSA